jgi:hypothetical protein
VGNLVLLPLFLHLLMRNKKFVASV